MSKDPAFIFYPGDYLRDTQTLSEKSQVAYDRIMCEHMRNICISQMQLKFFTKKLNEEELEELMYVLTKIKGGFQIEWVALSILKRKAYSESRSKNRKGKPKEHMKNISKTYDSHMENEIENENVKENESKNDKKNNSEIIFSLWTKFSKKQLGTIPVSSNNDQFKFMELVEKLEKDESNVVELFKSIFDSYADWSKWQRTNCIELGQFTNKFYTIFKHLKDGKQKQSFVEKVGEHYAATDPNWENL